MEKNERNTFPPRTPTHLDDVKVLLSAYQLFSNFLNRNSARRILCPFKIDQGVSLIFFFHLFIIILFIFFEFGSSKSDNFFSDLRDKNRIRYNFCLLVHDVTANLATLKVSASPRDSISKRKNLARGNEIPKEVAL